MPRMLTHHPPESLCRLELEGGALGSGSWLQPQDLERALVSAVPRTCAVPSTDNAPSPFQPPWWAVGMAASWTRELGCTHE
jgi:hypothetical protein